MALVLCLQRCVAPDVFLRSLADKFTRLALQLLARYAAWLSQGLAAAEQPPPAPAQQASPSGAAPQPLPQVNVNAARALLNARLSVNLIGSPIHSANCLIGSLITIWNTAAETSLGARIRSGRRIRVARGPCGPGTGGRQGIGYTR